MSDAIDDLYSEYVKYFVIRIIEFFQDDHFNVYLHGSADDLVKFGFKVRFK